MLKIYPTNRAIRESLKDRNNTFLDKSITIGEFEKRVLLVDGKKGIDDDKRTLYLKRATNFENFKKLKVPNDYLRFLSSSRFLFGFLEELAIERVDIDSIDSFDTYAEYVEHLSILKELLRRYEELLEIDGYYDKIILPKEYKINEKYIKRFKKIYLYLDGYLSRFELDILKRVSEISELVIYFQTNIYTKKMIDRFEEFGIELDFDRYYELQISKGVKKVIKKVDKSIKRVYLSKVRDRVLQVGFVKKKIFDFLEMGLEPSEIVVITPDESFVDILNLFDSNNIFNFAAGFSFKNSEIYKRVEAYNLYLEDNNMENFYRIKRVLGDMDLDKMHSFAKDFEFEELMENFIREDDNEQDKELFRGELYNFRVLKDELKGYSLNSVLHLFLDRLSTLRVDDTSGGEITVMGVLESRLVNYKGVIVVDFNDSKVPQKSLKDMFLNSIVRKRASLPTSKDREDLQKNYYHKLFLGAKEIALCAVESDSEKISKFLDELDIKETILEEFSDDDFRGVLTEGNKEIKRVVDENIVEKFDFKSFLFSATSFKILLECRRRFYWQYVKKIREHDIPSNRAEAKDLGERLHKALYRLYEDRDSFKDEKELLLILSRNILQDAKDDILRFDLDMFLKKLERFARSEIERFEDGYRVHKRELKLFGDIEGFKIVGVIDRIDKRGDGYSLIDYKSGVIHVDDKKSFKKSSNFQMEFYYLLALQNGFDSVDELFFYDLNKGERVFEDFFEEKLSLLKSKFTELKDKESFDFSMSEDLKVCKYCPYKIFCARDE